jgi:hypothetical protein
MAFNGGKQGHIWKTEKDADADSAMTYVTKWVCDESKAAMFALRTGEAKLYRKIDGSCGAIIRGNDGLWNVYQRYDDKKNKFKDGTEIPNGYIKLPDGENTKVYKYQENHGRHRYYFKLLNRVQKSKGEQSIVDALYNVVDRDDLKLDKDYYSVELVGPNFNSTPVVLKNGIALHEAQVVTVKIPELDTLEEWFAWMKEYFTAYRDEGLIVSHKGRYWKIHGYKFCPDLPKNYTLPVLL